MCLCVFVRATDEIPKPNRYADRQCLNVCVYTRSCMYAIRSPSLCTRYANVCAQYLYTVCMCYVCGCWRAHSDCWCVCLFDTVCVCVCAQRMKLIFRAYHFHCAHTRAHTRSHTRARAQHTSASVASATASRSFTRRRAGGVMLAPVWLREQFASDLCAIIAACARHGDDSAFVC